MKDKGRRVRVSGFESAPLLVVNSVKLDANSYSLGVTYFSIDVCFHGVFLAKGALAGA